MQFTSLKGYVTATYQELVEALGEPDYIVTHQGDIGFGDGKVETEWEWYDDDCGKITIYDWKMYDGGLTTRSGRPYNWHIGGTSSMAIDAVTKRLNKQAWYA